MCDWRSLIMASNKLKGAILTFAFVLFEENGARMTPFTNPVILNSSHLLFSQKKDWLLYVQRGFMSDLKL